MLGDFIMVWVWMGIMSGVLFFAYFLTIAGLVLQIINEYVNM